MNHSRVTAVAFTFLLLGLTACNSGSSPDGTGPTGDQSGKAAQQWINGNFTRVADDQSPLHNSAWRDSSGTVWSEAVVNAAGNPGTIQAAQQGCNELGATLPTSAQLDQLAKLLGRDTSYGFHPGDLQDSVSQTGMAKTWAFSGMRFWSEPLSANPVPGDVVKGMNGDTGELTDLPVFDPVSGQPTLASAVCVFPAERPKLDCVLYSPHCKPLISALGPIEYVKGEGKAQAAVILSASDDQDTSTMILQLSDSTGSHTVSKTFEIGDQGLVSGEVDLSTGGVRYRLVCQGSRLFQTEPTFGQLCQ